MQTVLLVLHLLIALALIGVVLLQRSEGGALGIGGGGGAGSLFSARGVGNTLTRTTAILAVIFFITSIGLTILASRTGGGSLFDRPAEQGEVLPQLPGQGQAQPDQGQTQPQQEQGPPKVPVSQ
jgi:preprotein translocase subunit SecG